MIKVILVIVVLLVGVLLTPALREPIEPQIDQVQAFLGDKLEGPMTPVLTPFRRLKTRNEIGKAITALLHVRNRGYPPPEASAFTEFLVREVDDEDGLDAWGSPYVIVLKPDSVAVVSPGPDRELDTEDDVSKQIRYRWWRDRH